VRVRIVRPSVGIMDGVSLSRLIPGITYELPSELGYWLISRGTAELVPKISGDVAIPLDNPFAFEQLTQGVSVVPRIATAADQPNPRRRTPSKKR
jgi:hypothetical protein